MPTLTVTWRRTDVNNPWPTVQGEGPNVVVSEGVTAVAAAARENFQITQDVAISEDGLTRTVTYNGTSADIQDYIATIEPYFLPQLDQTADLYGITMDVDVVPDPA